MTQATLEHLAREAGLAPGILEQALEWQLVLWSGEASTRQREALARWRAADPAHERAWRCVQRLEERLGAIPPTVGAGSLRAAGRERALARRKLLLAAGAVAIGLAAAGGAHRSDWLGARFARLRTARGEIRTWPLADGSRVTLDTASAVDPQLTPAARRLRLIAGTIHVETAPDSGAAGRPFLVDTAEGEIRALGTRFTVRRTGAATEVGVLEGAVRLRPRRGPAAAARIGAGRRAQLTLDAVAHLPGAPPPPAWIDGLLVAEQMRLDRLLAELGRYRPGIIRCDPRVAALEVTGTFPLADTDRALRALVLALPVRVSTWTRYWVSVEPV